MKQIELTETQTHYRRIQLFSRDWRVEEHAQLYYNPINMSIKKKLNGRLPILDRQIRSYILFYLIATSDTVLK